MTNVDHKLIYEFSGSRNLNTTPLDVTGFDGDKFDYMVDIDGTTATNIELQYIFNLDSTNNYRQYHLRGVSSSAQALVNDSRIGIHFDASMQTTNSTCIRSFITGRSDSERYVDTMYGSTGSNIYKHSGYWKNTVDNLTDFRLTANVSGVADITLRIYQVPKQANLDNYDLMEVVEFSARDLNANPIVFSGLDGDSDGEYLVDYDIESTVSTMNILTTVNNDTTANYVSQRLENQSGSIASGNVTRSAIWALAGNTTSLKQQVSIDAESGRKRLVKSSASCITDTGTTRTQDERAVWYGNTADNIISLEVYNDIASRPSTGTVTLYKRDKNYSTDPVPMRVVAEHDLTADDFSAGMTLSNIEGDRLDEVKFEYIGEGSSQLRIQVNGDTGSNYTSQRLVGITSSVVSANNSLSYFYFCEDGATTNSSSFWLYPESGKNRPALSLYYAQENRVDFRAQWYDNTADEVSSAKVYSSNATVLTGKIRALIPEDSEQSSPSWTKTIN